MELATLENTLLAFPPMRRTVPITNTRMTASMTAYSAMSCPCSSLLRLRRYSTIDPPGGSGVANNADSDGDCQTQPELISFTRAGTRRSGENLSRTRSLLPRHKCHRASNGNESLVYCRRRSSRYDRTLQWRRRPAGFTARYDRSRSIAQELVRALGGVVEHRSRHHSEPKRGQHAHCNGEPCRDRHRSNGNLAPAGLTHVHHDDNAEVIISAQGTIQHQDDRQANQI